MKAMTSWVSLCAPLGPRCPGKSAAIPPRVKAFECLVEGLARQPVRGRGLNLGGPLVADLAKHLVLHLHEVTRVEEGAVCGTAWRARARDAS